MRAVWIGIPEHILAERHAHGHDKRDEVWDGVLHMSPLAVYVHQKFALDLLRCLMPIAARRGWVAAGDGMGVMQDPKTNYRIPDVLVYDEQRHATRRGLRTAILVVEVLSPDDESRDKFGFYAERGIAEVWIVEPTTAELEIYELAAGTYRRVVGRSPALGIDLATIDGTLRIADGDSVTTIAPTLLDD